MVKNGFKGKGEKGKMVSRISGKRFIKKIKKKKEIKKFLPAGFELRTFNFVFELPLERADARKIFFSG